MNHLMRLPVWHRTALANPAAEFRPGQWEAIDALVNHRKKLLVVERTGWGKAQSISP